MALNRREVLLLLSMALTQGAMAGKIPVVGILWHAGSRDEEVPYFDWIRDGFRQQGYVEGGNIVFEDRFPAERPELFDRFADDLIAKAVDVLLTISIPAALAAKKHTSIIPIVFVPVSDPVGIGLVTNLARPGANVTGVSSMAFDLLAKRMQIFKEVIPTLSRVGLLLNPTTKYDAERSLQDYREAASPHKVEIEPFELSEANSLDARFSEMRKRNCDGIIVAQTPLFFLRPVPETIASLAFKYRLPSMTPADLFPQSGSLMSYSARWADLFRSAPAYVKRILSGERPGDLPVQQPTSFDFVINLKTARSLGIDVGPTVLARADRTID